MSLWSCAICPKSFTRKGDLNRHRLLHTGIKPHVCATCGKSFAQRSGLNTHINVHTKAKPHICGIGICKKAFGDPSSCARHRKEFHRSEGAYKCFIPNCGTKIKRRSAFVAHLRKHGLDPRSFDIDAASRSSESSTPAPSVTASAENDDHNVQSRSISPAFIGDNSGCYNLASNGEAVYQWPEDRPYDCRGVDLSPPNNVLLPALEPTNINSLDIAQSVFPYLPSSFEDPFYSDSIFSTMVDYLYLTASPPSFSIFEPLLDTRLDVSQSSSPSPSSTYSALY